MWIFLLSKRLYKKATFLVILALIPALVVGYSALAQEDSGILTVALAQEGSDPLVLQIWAELHESSQLIRFVDCDSPAAAEQLVRAGKADSAWIFPADLQWAMERFAASWSDRDALVRVLEREENVTLMLAREKLGGILFKYCAPEVYLDFARDNYPELEGLSDEALLEYYDAVHIPGNLFSFEDREDSGAAEASSYLTTPVRGLLGVVIVLCALAAAMYYVQDRALGTFAWAPEGRLPMIELGCQLIAIFNVALVAWIALALSGMAASFFRELLILVLYALCTASFAMLVRRLCGGLRGLGTLLPLLVVVMLVVCPVFFDLGALRELQYLFPPTYYVGAVYHHRYLAYMALYTAVAGALYWVTGKICKRT